MQDSELKKLLSETCQVLPGQEDRAWKALRERLAQTDPASRWAWLYVPTWKGATVAFAAVFVLGFMANSVVSSYWPMSFASADSEAPGIYATSFYSHSAKAQVVWLNGMEPASDKPTYLDPTTVIPRSTEKSAGDPNRL
jgi:hypothetical protein